MKRPNLPPQQSLENQVQISGEIHLACRRGRGICPHHEKTARRKCVEVLAHHDPEAALHTVADHRGPNRTADYKPYLRRLSGANPIMGARCGHFRYQQMPGQRRATGAAPVANRTPKISRSLHPRLPRQHLRGPCGDVRR
jgi:hypothetical protein